MDKQDFHVEMVAPTRSEHNKPSCIIIYGLPSSGKTHLAAELSKGLGIYLLNSDFVRNKYCESMKDYFDNVVLSTKRSVDEENAERFTILCTSRISFIFDGNGLDLDVYGTLEKTLKRFDYDIIKIKVNTDESKCRENYRKRKVGLFYIDNSVIGDYVFFTPALIWKANNADIPESEYNYTVDNLGDMGKYNENIGELIEQIKKARSKQNER